MAAETAAQLEWSLCVNDMPGRSQEELEVTQIYSIVKDLLVCVACQGSVLTTTIIILFVAVSGRNQRLFLLLFDHFCHIYMCVVLLQKVLESSKFVFSNSNLPARDVPTFGFNCPSITIGELSQLKTE